MPFLTLMHVTARNVNGDTINHPPQTVLSDWELEPYAREKILEGSEWYRARYEPLTEREAEGYRVRATQSEPPHILNDGSAQVIIAPPYADYVGLHPTEIIERLKHDSLDKAMQARRYELAGPMRRPSITGFVHPAERVPFTGYDEMGSTAICEKLELLPDEQIDAAKIYEAAHQGRPAILEFEKETTEALVA